MAKRDKALASLAILLYNIAIICDDFYKYALQAAEACPAASQK
jgi:hypothetical protein